MKRNAKQSRALVRVDPQTALARMAAAGQVADEHARAAVFSDYRSRKAANTLTRQRGDLALFAAYLTEAGLTVGDLAQDPQAWRGMTFGLVAGFVRWMLKRGYAVTSANVRLSTVKVYAQMAFTAGALDLTAAALIRTVKGYQRIEGKRVDEQRQAAGVAVRVGPKKSEAVTITQEQAERLKQQPNKPQGRRDALLMCLLLDHGLRVGELAGLEVKNFRGGTLKFYRSKVDRTQTHDLTPDALKAWQAYSRRDAPKRGGIWRTSIQSTQRLDGQGMTPRGLTKRVRLLGRRVGLEGLSAHDARHYWATQAVRSGTPIDRLQDAGGWASPAMPLQYIEAAKIANEGVILSRSSR